VKKPPEEVIGSLLAVTTIFVSLPPLNLPAWGIFISWAGTFAMGGPSKENLKRIWPVMPIGSITACLVVVAFTAASKSFSGYSFIVAEMIILFCLDGAMMLLGRLRGLKFVPGMFFGFASYFATVFGGFGPIPHDPLASLGVAVVANALGPIYAWLTTRLSAPHTD
jgi:hypothetical protein